MVVYKPFIAQILTIEWYDIAMFIESDAGINCLAIFVIRKKCNAYDRYVNQRTRLRKKTNQKR